LFYSSHKKKKFRGHHWGYGLKRVVNKQVEGSHLLFSPIGKFLSKGAEAEKKTPLQIGGVVTITQVGGVYYHPKRVVGGSGTPPKKEKGFLQKNWRAQQANERSLRKG